MGNDFTGTLKKLAEMGYTGVEFAGYGGLSAQEMKQVLDDNGLKSVGSHIGLDALTNRLDEEIAYNKLIGSEYIVCPHAKIAAEDDAVKTAEILKPIIAKINDAGLKFAYHNHAHEFVKNGNEYLLDIFFQHLPPEAAMELDVYWAAYAEVEPLAYMEKHKDRLKLIHVKQIDKDKQCVDLDKGVLDFKEIIGRAKKLGAEHFILEQEKFAVSSIVSVKNGIDHILKLEE
jgi:sugar phosphate isomerase/epimerase